MILARKRVPRGTRFRAFGITLIPMSYSIRVTVTDGKPEVIVSGPAPDGTYTLAGHIDDQREDVSAKRVTSAGQLASRSSGTVYKEV